MRQEDFKSLFDNHFTPLRNYIYYRSDNQELATDVAQESFMRIWEKQLSQPAKNQIGLLYKIALDLYISKRRHLKVVENFTMQEQHHDMAHSPEDEMAYQELKTRYETALLKLSESERSVFLMSRMEELKYHEIADRLQLSVKSVEKKMTAALKYLRQALGQS